MFHIGHLNIIKRAKDQCEYLIVGVTTDELCIKRKKKKPIICEEERVEIVDAIKYDINWLGYNWEKLCFGSEYFEMCYDFAEKLIMKGKAYVCDLDKDQIREYRGHRK